MYYAIVRQFVHTLQNLDACLGKAEAYAKQRGFDVNNFCGARLFPDMLPFAVQIRIACDQAKYAAGNLSGKVIPKSPDTEQTVAELRLRIGACLEFLQTFEHADFAKVDPQAVVSVPYPPGKALATNEYLLSRQVPQFFFHVTMAYALLRQGGVDLGKADYLGKLNLLDAPST